MNRPITIIVAIFAFGALGYNFYDNPEVSHLFGKEINDWLYRAFWMVIIGLCVYNYAYLEKNTLRDKSKKRR